MSESPTKEELQRYLRVAKKDFEAAQRRTHPLRRLSGMRYYQQEIDEIRTQALLLGIHLEG